jgi:hypothetical protein
MIVLESLKSETPNGKCANCDLALDENHECKNGCTGDPLYTMMEDTDYRIAVETKTCPVCGNNLNYGVCDQNQEHWPPEDIDPSYFDYFDE